MSAALQLELPWLGPQLAREPIENAVVEVVLDDRGERPRVRPVAFLGWVRFPKRLRKLGALYRVALLKPLPGGAWAACGKIRQLSR